MIPGPQFDSAHCNAVCIRTSALQTQLLAQRPEKMKLKGLDIETISEDDFYEMFEV